MDVGLLWFECSNADCDYIPLKTKKDKIKKYWRHGESIQNAKRKRRFLKYVQGYYIRLNNGDRLEFVCKYGTIFMYDKEDTGEYPNSHIEPIKDKEQCEMCIRKKENERLMQI